MRNHSTELEKIANDLLSQQAFNETTKPNYTNRDFFNAILIFNTALVDKVFDNQDHIGMEMEERVDMINKCGHEVRSLILKYTGLDTHDTHKFLK